VAKIVKNIAWEVVELDWRAGAKSKKQMAEEHGVSRAAIDKHFAKLGIERDLTVQIKARSNALVAQQVAQRAVAQQAVTADRLHVTEKIIVEANANLQVAARNKHRELAERKLALNEALLVELETQTANPADFEKLGELLRCEGARGVDKLNDVYRRVISSPSRVDSFRKLVEAHRVVVALHRQSVGLSDDGNCEADNEKQTSLTPNDAARRIAFTLLQAAKGN